MRLASLFFKDGTFKHGAIFCKGYEHGEREDHSKGNWNLKRNVGITHFSQIIKEP